MSPVKTFLLYCSFSVEKVQISKGFIVSENHALERKYLGSYSLKG
jgi:hypothetical protein